MQESGRIVRKVLDELSETIRPGLASDALDRMAGRIIRSEGGKPSFRGYNGFPKNICVSLNNEVVHGIPSKDRVVKEGDLVKIDVGVFKNGFHADAATTIGVEPLKETAKKLIEITKEALNLGIQASIIGNRIQDIGRAIQEYVEKAGFSIVRDLVGHGVGKQLHEEPQVPNFVDIHPGPKLTSGMTLAIEPMVNVGTSAVIISSDDWTVITTDGSLSAHFENTIAVTPDGPWVLTAAVN
jgi:methionyl aminopeptidase